MTRLLPTPRRPLRTSRATSTLIRRLRLSTPIVASVLATGLLLATPAACDTSDAATHARIGAVHPATGTMDHSRIDHSRIDHAGMVHGAGDLRTMEIGEPSDFSIYHLESTWTDQTGRDRPLRSLEGRVQVVAMLYTSCAYACPRIMLDLKRIEGELGAAADGEVGFVVVSIDPERDTPERLAEFASGSRLDPSHWTLLTAHEGDLLELAALLGVQYRQTAPGEWVHSNVITVLDREGEIVHRQIGLGTDLDATIAAIRASSR